MSHLSLMVFFPLFGAGLLYLLPMFRSKENIRELWHPHSNHDDKHEIKYFDKVQSFSLLVTIITFVLSLLCLTRFNFSNGNYQLQENVPWIPSFGISYSLGMDGISLVLVLLTTFLMPIVVLASHSVKTLRRGYLASMLVLETAMLGTLVSLDVFLFYVFWELMLAPMYFIIGIWGGKRRIYATLKFVLYTVFGSVLMLAGIIYLAWQYYGQEGNLNFYLPELIRITRLSFKEEVFLFAAFALAFSIKVPLFPFHTWLPDAHVEAPTGGSVVLAGVLLKMGLYGFIRFAYPLFPRGAEYFTPVLASLAVVGIVYGALVAWAQTDIKKLVAYSSVSHLGFCMLGLVALNSMATTGSIYQMLNHGVSTGALFLLVGVLYDRRHTRAIEDFGGLASKVPVFAFFFLVFTLSSVALPLTNGFVGEFLILVGSFQTFPLRTAIAVSGVVLGAVYMLTLYMRTMYGELDEKKNGALTDMNKWELCSLLPLLVLVFWMGIYPKPFLTTMEPSVNVFLAQVEARTKMLAKEEKSGIRGREDYPYVLPAKGVDKGDDKINQKKAIREG